MPQKRRSQSWTELKQAGNECFKAGQYGEAISLYSQTISLLQKSGQKNQQDLSILYSNRAASYLKNGNCGECINDCTTSLELAPFGIKSLLRRAASYEALERYRQAYVDYKTVLQIDCNLPAAHDGTNRMTKALIDMDGPSWREKLPPIPTVPMAIKEKLLQSASTAPTIQQNGVQETSNQVAGDDKKARLLKEEGNAFVKKGEHKKAVEKYTQSLSQDPTEVTTYTNRALCYLSLKMYKEAVKDCEKALQLDSANVKALYRRAQAYVELKDKRACAEDLKSLLKIEPKNTAAQKLLQEVQKMK
ncbi:mitochondrial import receptor subunit TOM34 [Electrophorus electricus]|uniref:Translocase of outer mitochondrial membrane 34 n=1 Tax=Electrophorus electricus TaxID=8005 RepID=A0A4W4DZK1_ELEEL|nr:mitochondrial import receptor subunit TOM34 [Electrophorus electricus]XP_026860772.2 mitochondrial import receptor subunit TOM34 [Electrophorus electricus]XP_026860773.2 mitochondrial import receptor subunit TOM34 [Electrophorus electricus]